MQNYQQNYNFNNNYLQSKGTINSYDNEEKAKKFIIIWLICLVTGYALPVISGLYYSFFAALFNVSVERYTLFSEIIIGGFNLIIFGTKFAQHVIAIVAKIKYPKSKNINTIFIIDMVILVFSVLMLIIGVIALGIFCGTCINEVDECG